ncbi:stAR-related lipid transfer protein 9 [Rhinophrynus dorsalis]
MANVRVALRVRPPSKRETAEGARIILNVDEKVARIRNLKLDHKADGCGDTRERLMEFGFDYCYWSVDPGDPKYASQEVVFQDLGTSVLSEAINGYNVCLFAYGQTGSGKTYTMMGTPASVGLTPRICEGLFSCSEDSPETPSSSRIEVSFLEIYNERVRDLLNQLEQKKPYTLRIREHPEKGPYVQGLSQHVVTDYEQVVALLEEGMENRITAATHVHDASSRSHAIFTIQYTKAMLEDGLPTEIASKINLVDLAGSERASPNYCKDRLTEGSNINRSLVTLGIVISALAQNSQMTSSCQSINSIASDGDSGSPGSMNGAKRQPYVPYRDSILTWLLKDSLGGNSKTIMIATVSPSSSSYNETMSTLRYASHAKNIINKPRVNEDANVKLIRDLREEINRLKNMLRSFEMRTISPSFSDERDGNLTELVLQNEMKIEQLTKDWTDKWTDKAAIMEQYNVDINEGKAGVTIDSNLPHLIEVNDDILSTGVVIYHLREGTTKIGRSDSDQDIVLQGEWIEKEHCTIVNHGGVVELCPVPRAHCTVNGQEVTGVCRLSQGAVIVLGKTHRFRFNHPTEAAILRQRRSDSQASFLSSGSLDWLDLSGDFTPSSNENSLLLNARTSDPQTEEYEQKLRDLEAFYQQRVEEQQCYVEDLKRQIQAAQVRGEKELEDEQSIINQLIKENQQWLMKEEQRLTTVHNRRRESAVQTDHKTYAEAEVQNTVQSDSYPTPAEKDRKKLVQLELIRKCSLSRAERNIRRKRVKYQLDRIVKKQKLLEAKKNLQQLQDVCWISEATVKQTCPLNPNSQEHFGICTALRRSRSSPHYRRRSLTWSSQPLNAYSTLLKRQGKCDFAASIHNHKPSEDHKPRRSASFECLLKNSCKDSSIVNCDYEQRTVPTASVAGAEKRTFESVAHRGKTVSDLGATFQVNYTQMSKKRQKMDKGGNRSKGISNNCPTEPPKKKNVSVASTTGTRETKSKSTKSSSSLQSVGSIKKSGVLEKRKLHEQTEASKSPSQNSTKSAQKSVSLGKPSFGNSIASVRTTKRESASSLSSIQNRPADTFDKISSSVDSIDRLNIHRPTQADGRRWQSTERLNRGLLMPTTEQMENWKEDDEADTSDSESFYSVDSLSSAYTSALNEQLKREESEKNKIVGDQKDSDSEDSQMSQDSLVARENRKEKPNRRRFNKYKTVMTPSSSSGALATEQDALSIVMAGSVTGGLSKSFSLDSLADAEDVPEADSCEEMPAEIFWKLQSPRFSVPLTEDESRVDVTQVGDSFGMELNYSFYLNWNPEPSTDYSDTTSGRKVDVCSKTPTNINEIKSEPLNDICSVISRTCSSLEETLKCNPDVNVSGTCNNSSSILPTLHLFPKTENSLNEEINIVENSPQEMGHGSPNPLVLKPVNTELLDQQEKQQCCLEIIDENINDNIALPKNNLESWGTALECTSKQSTSAELGNTCVIDSPDFMDLQNQSCSHGKFTTVNEQMDCHISSCNHFIRSRLDPQVCCPEDVSINIADHLGHPPFKDGSGNEMAMEDDSAQKGMMSSYTTDESMTVTDAKISAASPTIVAEDICMKETDTEKLALEMCKEILSTQLNINSATMPPSQMYLNKNKDVKPTVFQKQFPNEMQSEVTSFNQKESFESTVVASLLTTQENSDTCLYSSDTAAESFGQHDNIGNTFTLAVPACVLLDNKNYSCTSEGGSSSESALSSASESSLLESQIFQQNVIDTATLFENGVENHKNEEVAFHPSLCDPDFSATSTHLSTSSLQLDEIAKTECSNTLLQVISTPEKGTGVASGMCDSLNNDNTGIPVQRQSTAGDERIVTMSDIFTNCTSDSEVNMWNKKSSIDQQTKPPALFGQSDAINSPQTEKNTCPETREKGTFLPLYLGNGIKNSPWSKISDCRSQCTIDATERHIKGSDLPDLLSEPPQGANDMENCRTPVCEFTDNFYSEDNRKRDANPIRTSSHLTIDNGVNRSVNLKEAERENDEDCTVSLDNIVSNHRNNFISLQHSVCTKETFDLNISVSCTRPLFPSHSDGEIATDVSLQESDSQKDTVDICIQPSCGIKSNVQQEAYDTPNVCPQEETDLEEIKQKPSRQNENVVTHSEDFSKVRKPDDLYGEAIIVPEICEKKALLKNSEQVKELSAAKPYCCVPEGVVPSVQGLTSQVSQNHNEAMHTSHGSLTDNFRNNKSKLQSISDAYPTLGGSEKLLVVDEMKLLAAENTMIPLKGSTYNLSSATSMDSQDCMPCRLHDASQRCRLKQHDNHNLFVEDYVTQPCLCKSENCKPEDLNERTLEVSETISAKTNDISQIPENNMMPNSKLHFTVKNEKPQSSGYNRRALRDMGGEEASYSINSYASMYPSKEEMRKAPTKDNSESGDSVNMLYLGINSRSSSFQANSASGDDQIPEDINGKGLILPYYEAVMQNELFCETKYNKAKMSKSSPLDKKNDVLKHVNNPRSRSEGYSGTSNMNALIASRPNQSQEHGTYADGAIKGLGNGSMYAKTHHQSELDTLHRADYCIPDNPAIIANPQVCPEHLHSVPKLNAISSSTGESPLTMLVDENPQLVPSISGKVKYFQSGTEGGCLHADSACEVNDYSPSNEVSHKDFNDHDKMQGENTSVSQKRKCISVTTQFAFWQKSDIPSADHGLREKNKQEGTNSSQASSCRFVNPGSTQHHSDASYSILTCSVNDENMKTNTSQNTSAECYICSRMLQETVVPLNNHPVWKKYPETSKSAMENSHADMISNKPVMSCSNAGNSTVCNLSSPYQTTSQIPDELSLFGDTKDTEQLPVSKGNSSQLAKTRKEHSYQGRIRDLKENDKSLDTQRLNVLGPNTVNVLDICTKPDYSFLTENCATKEDTIMPLSCAEYSSNVGTLHAILSDQEHTKLSSTCFNQYDNLHMTKSSMEDLNVLIECEGNITVDKSTERTGEFHVPTTLCGGLNSCQDVYFKVENADIKLTETLAASSAKDQPIENSQTHNLSSHSNHGNSDCKKTFSFSARSLQNVSPELSSYKSDNIINIERRTVSTENVTATSELSPSHVQHIARDYGTPSCTPSSCTNQLVKSIKDSPSNTPLHNICYYKDMTSRAAPEQVRNVSSEMAPMEKKSDRELEENNGSLHFSSSDINPFVHSWQQGEHVKSRWRQYSFNSASDVSYSKFPVSLKADKIMRCSSVDDGLNANNSPFHSHLSSYANARMSSSTLSSIEDLKVVNDTSQDFQSAHSLEGSPYYYHHPLSDESIVLNSKQGASQIDSTNNLEPKSDNCSMQVDEIVLLYTSESETCNENNMTVTCEQGTQTKTRNRRTNRHQRSHTDVSSAKLTKGRNLHQRPASWSSVQNMSLHLSQLIHETSELLGNLSQHHGADLYLHTSNLQERSAETDVRRTVRESSTQTTIDQGIQTDFLDNIQTRNNAVEKQDKESNGFLNGSEINVIVKVIGTDPLNSCQKTSVGQNVDEAQESKTQSLPNLHNVDSCKESHGPLAQSSHIRASTSFLSDWQKVTCHKTCSPSRTRVSPDLLILDNEDNKPSRIALNSCGKTVMVDRASSPILTLQASKRILNKTISEENGSNKNIVKHLKLRKNKESVTHEPQVDNSSQTETDSECASSHGSSKMGKKSKSFCSSFRDSPSRRVSEDIKLAHRFRSEHCILKETRPLDLHRSSSICEVSGIPNNFMLTRRDKADGTSELTLNSQCQTVVLHPWDRPQSLENLSQTSQPVHNKTSQSLLNKGHCNGENERDCFPMKSNNLFFKNKNDQISASEMSGFVLNLQEDDALSVVESECNTDVLLKQNPSIRMNHRPYNYTLQDLPLHNKFSNWSGVQGSPPSHLHRSSVDLYMRESPTKTEVSMHREKRADSISTACESRDREIERLQRERAEIMSGIHLELNPQPLTVQLAEAKLSYGIGETDALLRVIQNGKVEKQDNVSLKKQLYEKHMKVIENLRKEREDRLQSFRRSRSLSPQKHLSASQGSLTSLRESDLPSRRREYLQQLRRDVVDNTRIHEPKRRTAQCPSDIELMLKDYQKAREEAKNEIARARDKLRERAELEKKRLQQSCQPKEDVKLKSLMSTSTLCTGSSLSLSSGPTSGYNSSSITTAPYSKSSQMGNLDTKVFQRSNDLPSGVVRGRSAVRNHHLLAASQTASVPELNAVTRLPSKDNSSVETPPGPGKHNPSYIPYSSSPTSSSVLYQDFARKIQASATAEIMAACSHNIKNLFQCQAASGWMYQCIERDVFVYYKAFPSATKHGFLGAGVIKRPIHDVWCIVRDISTRRLYDQSVISAQLHQRVGSGIQLVHVISDMSLCYLKQPRDFCCISVESKEEQWYSLCFQSLYNESMPRPSKDTVRGELLPSAWILQPDTIDGEKVTRIIYMVQVDLCAPAIPSRLLSVVTKRQPLVIASLASFLSR